MQQPDCDLISGRGLRGLFNQELTLDRLESFILHAFEMPAQDLQRRQDQDVFYLDWEKDGVQYTVGLQNGALLFIDLHFAQGQLPARRVIGCLGPPEYYQAFYSSLLKLEFSSVQVALLFPAHRAIAYGYQHFRSASSEAPTIGDSLPVNTISFFDRTWQEDERALANSAPWPGDWGQVHIDVFVTNVAPMKSSPDQAADAWPGGIDEVLEQIAQAFEDAPRPADQELLHPDAYDDGDIQALIGVPHWRELPDSSVEYEYSALAFLSPAGFRHFLPAYLSWVLRHPDSGAAVVGSTLSALTPSADEPLRGFMLSKFSLLDSAQRLAVVSFLRAMVPYEDVGAALDYWQPHGAGE